MPYRQNIFKPGNYYHIYNRGVNQQNIFFGDKNYLFAIKLIKRYTTQYLMSMIAYCLMPNHYHFLLRQDGEIPVSKFINVVFNAYVQALNRQLHRTGTLFEGRFRHVHVNKESYIMHLCRYIHLNPVQVGIVNRPEEWPYSNYREWVGLRTGTLCDSDFMQSYFPTPDHYSGFVNDYIMERELEEKLKPYLLE